MAGAIEEEDWCGTRPPAKPSNPTIMTLAAFPLLPGLLVVYHDSQIGGQSGWGGWVVYAWWGTGSRRIGTLWRRFS